MPDTDLTILSSHLPSPLHSLEADALWLMPMLNKLSIVIIVMVLIWSLVQTFNHNPPAHFMRIWGQLILLWLGPTMPWWALVVLVSLVATMMPIGLGILLLLIIGLYFYSVCVVPNQLHIRKLTIPASAKPNMVSIASSSATHTTSSTVKKMIVISNIRLGLFSHPSRLNRLVNTINELEADCVLVLGEWLYNPPADLVGRLMQIKAINKPIYAIQGAHDNRYVPDNADQFLHEDDLNHAFDSLGIIEVNGITQSSNGLRLVAKPTKLGNLNAHNLNTNNLNTHVSCSTNQAQALNDKHHYPAVALCNSLSQMQYCLTTLQNSDAGYLSSNQTYNQDKYRDDQEYMDSLNSMPSTLILLPDDSKALKSKQLSEQALAHNALITIIPSFGRRGLPFRFNQPSITLLHINVK